MILATDMARHNAQLAQMKQVIQRLDKNSGGEDAIMDWITEGEESSFEKSEDFNLKKFKNQQIILDILIHTADISQQCRPFETVKEWTYLLFEEFFDQGDLEKKQDLPISMLCDRETTNVAKS